MNDQELEAVKAGIEGATAGAFQSIQDVIRKLAGPAAEEFGLGWRDQVRVWRFAA